MGVEAFRRILEDEWREEVPGRIEPVPKPKVVAEAPSNTRQVSLKRGDVVFIHDEGEPVVEPRSLGWREERVEEHIMLDCYSAHSFERIEGIRDENNEEEEYGGMQGETKRILDKYRKGYKNFDLIIPQSWIDLHDEEPGGIWRGQWNVTLVEAAAQIPKRNDPVFD